MVWTIAVNKLPSQPIIIAFFVLLALTLLGYFWEEVFVGRSDDDDDD
jgi:hypothetical protein